MFFSSFTICLKQLNKFNIIPDEGYLGDHEIGNYGPYVQSQRADIYRVVIKHLIEEGKAYPCFCSTDDLAEIRKQQEAIKENPGYYGKYARCRDLTNEEVNNIIALEKMTVEYIIPNTEEYKPMPEQMHRTSRTYGLESSIGYNLSCLLNLPDDVLNSIYRNLAYQLIKGNIAITNVGLLTNKQKITVDDKRYHFKLYPRKCFGDTTLRLVFCDEKGILPDQPHCNNDYKFQLQKIDEEEEDKKE